MDEKGKYNNTFKFYGWKQENIMILFIAEQLQHYHKTLYISVLN